jgi:hypothetical protein
MANVNLLSFTLRDIVGNTGNVVIPVPIGLTLAQYQTFVTDQAAKLDDITGALVESANLSMALTLPAGLKAGAVASHYIGVGANMAYDAANTPYRFTVRIPAVLLSKVVGEAVDGADADVTVFNLNMTVGDGTVSPSDKYGNDLLSFLGGNLTFRKG